MATLTTLIAAALVKLGLQVSKERGWYPRSYYVKTALEALRADDIDRAIEELGLAWRDEPGEEVEVAREVILMRLDADLKEVDTREAVARKMRDVAEGEITVLDLRLRRLRFNYRPTQAWVAAGAALVVVASTIFSVVRFSLHPAIAIAGLAVFGVGAALLITVDRRRQHAVFESHRAQIGAEVAEEIQILRAEIRAREGEILAARADRGPILARQGRLPAIDRSSG
jgi:hypothetical protein